MKRKQGKPLNQTLEKRMTKKN